MHNYIRLEDSDAQQQLSAAPANELLTELAAYRRPEGTVALSEIRSVKLNSKKLRLICEPEARKLVERFCDTYNTTAPPLLLACLLWMRTVNCTYQYTFTLDGVVRFALGHASSLPLSGVLEYKSLKSTLRRARDALYRSEATANLVD
jgi:hypothetical protein